VRNFQAAALLSNHGSRNAPPATRSTVVFASAVTLRMAAMMRAHRVDRSLSQRSDAIAVAVPARITAEYIRACRPYIKRNGLIAVNAIAATPNSPRRRIHAHTSTMEATEERSKVRAGAGRSGPG